MILSQIILIFKLLWGFLFFLQTNNKTELLCKASTIVWESQHCHKNLQGLFLNMRQLLNASSTSLKVRLCLSPGQPTALSPTSGLTPTHRAIEFLQCAQGSNMDRGAKEPEDLPSLGQCTVPRLKIGKANLQEAQIPQENCWTWQQWSRGCL